ncbi:hypothetical protein B9479_003803 [Cryptococcus floricola]|uniref:Uncharacterized protein n=1 Tax=Cryptococcus floricola TaxID=2591691 RepID=A0A5D3AZ31_9TREE|nr:hypothetical protein B9479_003803 [Cryptococcus floricola]
MTITVTPVKALKPPNSNSADNVPRPLTKEELWSAWELCPLPPYLQVAEDDSNIPTRYPSLRLTYELVPPAIAAENHAIRLFQVHIRDQILRFCTPNADLGEWLRSFLSWRNGREGRRRPRENSLGLSMAEDHWVQGADSAFRSGDYKTALWRYATKWSYILPFHTDAFPSGHPLRQKIGGFESSLFNRLSACFFQLSQDGDEGEEDEILRYFVDMSVKCAWVTIHHRQFATVRSVYEATRRIADLFNQHFHDPDFSSSSSSSSIGDNDSSIDNDFNVQALALEDVDKDLIFGNLGDEKKTVLGSLGPVHWESSRGEAGDFLEMFPHWDRNQSGKEDARVIPESVSHDDIWSAWALTTSLADNADAAIICTAQLHLMGVLYIASHTSHHSPDFQTWLEKLKVVDTASVSLAERVDRADRRRVAAMKQVSPSSLPHTTNADHRNLSCIITGDHQTALAEYVEGLGELLPFHLNVLTQEQVDGTYFGWIQATLWNGISTICLALSESPSGVAKEKLWKRLAFMSGSFAWGWKKYTTIPVVMSICNNLLSTIPRQTDVTSTLDPPLLHLKSTFERQVEQCEMVKKGEKRQPEQYKTTSTDGQFLADYGALGPGSWIDELRSMKGKVFLQ